MKIYRFYILGIAALLTACSASEQHEAYDTPLSDLPISLGFEDIVETRAVSYFDTNANVDVFIKENNGNKNYGRLVAVAAANHSLTLSPTQYWPAENGINIYSWYPSGYVGTNIDATDVTFTVAADQTGGWTTNDLLFGKPVRVGTTTAANPIDRTGEVITLGYNHVMSKVSITLNKGETGITDNDLKGVIVSMTSVLPDAELNLKTGVITSSGTPSALIVYKRNDSGVASGGTWIMPPQSLEGKAMRVALANGAVYSYIFKNTDGMVEAGKEYTYTLTLKTTDIEMSATVRPWEGGTTAIIGDALMP